MKSKEKTKHIKIINGSTSVTERKINNKAESKRDGAVINKSPSNYILNTIQYARSINQGP